MTRRAITGTTEIECKSIVSSAEIRPYPAVTVKGQ